MTLLHKQADRVRVHDRCYLEVDRVLARGKSCWEEHRVQVHKAPVYTALAHTVRVHKVQACKKALEVVCSSDLVLGMQHGHKDLKHERDLFLISMVWRLLES